MKKISRLLLPLLIIFALLLTAGCGDSPGKVDENIKNVKITEKEFTEKENTVYLLEVSRMKDESLQKKINENLQKATLSLVRKGGKDYLEGKTEALFFNDRLLVALFDGNTDGEDANGNTAILKGIHIDLTNGKVYEPVEIFKKGTKYEEELLKIAQEDNTYRLYSAGNPDWKFGTFKGYWDPKKNNQFFVLTADYLWIYTFSIEEEGIVPGYAIPYDDIKHLIDDKSNLWQAMTSGENRAQELDVAAALFEFEDDVDRREAGANANAQMEEMERAEAEKKANEEKIAAIQKAADAKVTAAQQQTAAAQKQAAAAQQQAAAAKKAASAKTGSTTWKITKTDRSNTALIVQGTFTNNTNKKVTQIYDKALTVTYKTKSGAQKTFRTTFNAHNVTMNSGGTSSRKFEVKLPADYGSYVKSSLSFKCKYI